VLKSIEFFNDLPGVCRSTGERDHLREPIGGRAYSSIPEEKCSFAIFEETGSSDP
jgi:hypothetical protein